MRELNHNKSLRNFVEKEIMNVGKDAGGYHLFCLMRALIVEPHFVEHWPWPPLIAESRKLSENGVSEN